ncbi:hypothetical protein FVE85_1305 [Porphyridium purpureum]|uniref:Uncharacterized protein n=1 Tax=Porphyridium purpureum TaxID=35688 RepID=A0A5J4YHW7_PORPP|nr:hypothetical protein FVE85_1305 [Porphyridium purpureum]|eukprot:POR4696..scf251_18
MSPGSKYRDGGRQENPSQVRVLTPQQQQQHHHHQKQLQRQQHQQHQQEGGQQQQGPPHKQHHEEQGRERQQIQEDQRHQHRQLTQQLALEQYRRRQQYKQELHPSQLPPMQSGLVHSPQDSLQQSTVDHQTLWGDPTGMLEHHPMVASHADGGSVNMNAVQPAEVSMLPTLVRLKRKRNEHPLDTLQIEHKAPKRNYGKPPNLFSHLSLGGTGASSIAGGGGGAESAESRCVSAAGSAAGTFADQQQPLAQSGLAMSEEHSSPNFAVVDQRNEYARREFRRVGTLLYPRVELGGSQQQQQQQHQQQQYQRLQQHQLLHQQQRQQTQQQHPQQHSTGSANPNAEELGAALMGKAVPATGGGGASSSMSHSLRSSKLPTVLLQQHAPSSSSSIDPQITGEDLMLHDESSTGARLDSEHLSLTTRAVEAESAMVPEEDERAVTRTIVTEGVALGGGGGGTGSSNTAVDQSAINKSNSQVAHAQNAPEDVSTTTTLASQDFLAEGYWDPEMFRVIDLVPTRFRKSGAAAQGQAPPVVRSGSGTPLVGHHVPQVQRQNQNQRHRGMARDMHTEAGAKPGPGAQAEIAVVDEQQPRQRLAHHRQEQRFTQQRNMHLRQLPQQGGACAPSVLGRRMSYGSSLPRQRARGSEEELESVNDQDRTMMPCDENDEGEKIEQRMAVPARAPRRRYSDRLARRAVDAANLDAILAAAEATEAAAAGRTASEEFCGAITTKSTGATSLQRTQSGLCNANDHLTSMGGGNMTHPRHSTEHHSALSSGHFTVRRAVSSSGECESGGSLSPFEIRPRSASGDDSTDLENAGSHPADFTLGERGDGSALRDRKVRVTARRYGNNTTDEDYVYDVYYAVDLEGQQHQSMMMMPPIPAMTGGNADSGSARTGFVYADFYDLGLSKDGDAGGRAADEFLSDIARRSEQAKYRTVLVDTASEDGYEPEMEDEGGSSHRGSASANGASKPASGGSDAAVGASSVVPASGAHNHVPKRRRRKHHMRAAAVIFSDDEDVPYRNKLLFARNRRHDDSWMQGIRR